MNGKNGAACLALVVGLAAAAPQFDAASVKLAQEQRPISFRVMPGGRIVANAPVKLLLINAYGFQRSQIVGGPGWIDTDFYEVEARAAADAGRGQLMAMLRTLLEERFRIKVHRETREGPVYVLGIAKGGLKLAPPGQGDCLAPPCGQMRTLPSGRVVRLEGDRVPIAELLRVLAVVLNQPVLDHTNASGLFDIRLHFIDEPPDAPPSDSTEPTLSLALQEQLGLKLEASKGPVEYLIIDHIERPSAN